MAFSTRRASSSLLRGRRPRAQGTRRVATGRESGRPCSLSSAWPTSGNEAHLDVGRRLGPGTQSWTVRMNSTAHLAYLATGLSCNFRTRVYAMDSRRTASPGRRRTQARQRDGPGPTDGNGHSAGSPTASRSWTSVGQRKRLAGSERSVDTLPFTDGRSWLVRTAGENPMIRLYGRTMEARSTR